MKSRYLDVDVDSPLNPWPGSRGWRVWKYKHLHYHDNKHNAMWGGGEGGRADTVWSEHSTNTTNYLGCMETADPAQYSAPPPQSGLWMVAGAGNEDSRQPSRPGDNFQPNKHIYCWCLPHNSLTLNTLTAQNYFNWLRESTFCNHLFNIISLQVYAHLPSL